MLDDSADLNKVKEKILASRARYSFPKTEKKKESGDKDSDAGDNAEDDHIHMSLYNSSHPVSFD